MICIFNRLFICLDVNILNILLNFVSSFYSLYFFKSLFHFCCHLLIYALVLVLGYRLGAGRALTGCRVPTNLTQDLEANSWKLRSYSNYLELQASWSVQVYGYIPSTTNILCLQFIIFYSITTSYWMFNIFLQYISWGSATNDFHCMLKTLIIHFKE